MRSVVATMCVAGLLSSSISAALPEFEQETAPRAQRPQPASRDEAIAQREALRQQARPEGDVRRSLPGVGTAGAPSREQPAQEIRRLTAQIDAGSVRDEAARQALRRRAYLYATSGRVGLANRDLDVLLRQDSRDDVSHFIRGLVSLDHQPRTAVSAFSQVVRLQPGRPDGYWGRAWANLRAGSHGDAARDFDHVLRLEPGNAEAYRGRGWAHLQGRRYDQAIRDFSEVVRHSPNHGEGFLGRGLARYYAGQTTEAREDFRASMDFPPAPNSAFTYNNVRLDDWRRHETQAELLDERIRRNPGDVDAWLARGVANVRRLDGASGRTTEMAATTGARSSFDQAVKVRPGDIDPLMFRAMYYSTAEHNRRIALADLTEVIRLKPDYAAAYVRRALLLATDKDTLSAAVADGEKALALSPGNAGLAAAVVKLRADQAAWERQKTQAAIAQAKRDAANEALSLAALLALYAILSTTNIEHGCSGLDCLPPDFFD